MTFLRSCQKSRAVMSTQEEYRLIGIHNLRNVWCILTRFNEMLQCNQHPLPETQEHIPYLSDKCTWVLSLVLHNTRDLRLYVPSKRPAIMVKCLAECQNQDSNQTLGRSQTPELESNALDCSAMTRHFTLDLNKENTRYCEEISNPIIVVFLL